MSDTGRTENPRLLQRDGKPLAIFVVVIGFSRNELIKLGNTIESYGGQCSGFEAAQIVLSRRNVPLPPPLLQGLGQRVLLDVAWFQACIKENRLLGPAEDWGGHALSREQRAVAGPSGHAQRTSMSKGNSPPSSEGYFLSAQGPKFTEEDDTTLVRFFQEHLLTSRGGTIESVLHQLAQEHPSHTLEEWSYRYRHNQVHLNARIFEGDAEALLLSLDDLGSRLF